MEMLYIIVHSIFEFTAKLTEVIVIGFMLAMCITLIYVTLRVVVFSIVALLGYSNHALRETLEKLRPKQ